MLWKESETYRIGAFEGPPEHALVRRGDTQVLVKKGLEEVRGVFSVLVLVRVAHFLGNCWIGCFFILLCFASVPNIFLFYMKDRKRGKRRERKRRYALIV